MNQNESGVTFTELTIIIVGFTIGATIGVIIGHFVMKFW